MCIRDRDIIKYGIALLISALMALVFGVAAGRTASVASSGFARNLRGAMYDHVQEFSFANIDKFSTASIVTRLTTDVSNVQIAFQMCTRIAMRAPGMLIFALIAAFRIDAQLSMVYIGILPIPVSYTHLFTNTLSNLGVIKMPEVALEHIESMDFVLGTVITNRASCSMVTVNDTATFSINKMTVDPTFEEKMYELLVSDGIIAVVEGSQFYES